MPETSSHLADSLVHLGRQSEGEGRLVNLPIELGSTMLFDTLAAFEAAREARYEPGTAYYGRYGTGASFELERMMQALEGAYGCTLTSSGVAAVTLALMGLTNSGDHVLVADNVYGNTRGFCDNALTRQGIEVEYFDPMIGGGIAEVMRPNTSVVMFEAPGSGTFEVPDIPAIATATRAHGAVSVFDGTWATPIFCRPLSLGVDVVVHSGSKYIGGHSDSMIGLIACDEATYVPIRKMVMTIGDKPGSQEVFLTLRGMRSLGMRMKQAEAAGLEVARWLVGQPQVKRLLHPAFESCPGHEFWKRDFTGAAGLFGVVFHPCSDDQIRSFVDGLRMFGIGVSWGGYESLVLPVKPIRTASPWREEGQLVRFNIGFEDTANLIADLTQALPHLNSQP